MPETRPEKTGAFAGQARNGEWGLRGSGSGKDYNYVGLILNIDYSIGDYTPMYVTEAHYT